MTGGCAYWKEDAFKQIKAECEVKLEFLEFKSTSGLTACPTLTTNWKKFLSNIFHAINTNKGDIQNKVVTQGFNSFLQGIMLECGDHPERRKGLRHLPVFKQFTVAKQILDSKSQRFDRLNLWDGSAPDPRTCRKMLAQLTATRPKTFLDQTQEGIQEKILEAAKAVHLRWLEST